MAETSCYEGGHQCVSESLALVILLLFGVTFVVTLALAGQGCWGGSVSTVYVAVPKKTAHDDEV